MSLKLVRPVRFSAAAVVVLASMSAVAASDDPAPVASDDRSVVVQHRESRFASAWPQSIERSTMLVARKDRHKSVRVESTRGSRVWTASDLADNDVPTAALTAYQNAARQLSLSDPGCELPWTLLAAIGRVESDHGRFAGSVVSTDGVARPEIIGIALNGAGPVAAIRDSDGGKLDGDTKWDRAVGPMQFIPTTWAWAGRDGDGDGVANPHDLDDAALAAGDYLCAGASMSTGSGMKTAIFRYNPSDDYVALVRAFERGYSTGVFEVPSPAAKDKDAKKDKSKKDSDKKDKKRDKAKDRADRDKKKDDKSKSEGDPGKSGSKGGQAKPKPSPSPSSSPKPKPKPTPSSPGSPTPQPAGPTPSQPGPSQPGPGQQSPSPSNPPSSTPTPTPSPSPSPSPPAGPREMTRPLARCGATDWCLDGVLLEFGTGIPASLDLDGNGTSGTLDEELATLAAAGPVTMTVRGPDAGPFVVVKVGTVTFG
jgi:membrane-bound lytic murein transglycosylase B